MGATGSIVLVVKSAATIFITGDTFEFGLGGAGGPALHAQH